MNTIKQPIVSAVLAVDSDTFWNWMADTFALDLHDMKLIEVYEFKANSSVQFKVEGPKPPTFDEVMLKANVAEVFGA